MVGAGWVDGGSDRKPSTLEIAGAIETARTELLAAETQVGELAAALAGALAEQSNRQDAAEQALAALNESDAAISAIYEQLGRLGQDVRIAEEEWRRLQAQRDELEAGRTQAIEELAELEGRLRAAQETQSVVEASPGERQQIQAASEAARATEVEARLVVRTAEERANAVRSSRKRGHAATATGAAAICVTIATGAGALLTIRTVPSASVISSSDTLESETRSINVLSFRKSITTSYLL
jgi:chromosome segregation protein